MAVGNELVRYQALQGLVQAVGELRRVEIEIIGENRGRYLDQVFEIDRVLGYAKDLRLIEYVTKDVFGYGNKHVIIVYSYGENDDDTPGLVRRRPGDPSGEWARFFGGMPAPVFQKGQPGAGGPPGYGGGGGHDLSAGDQEAKLLVPPFTRSGEPDR